MFRIVHYIGISIGISTGMNTSVYSIHTYVLDIKRNFFFKLKHIKKQL